ncbi:MAG: hypothetical protein GQ532_13275 [Methylomarinum sp.]|nr:hypothetical protein [Methylomarinum sp.]
MSIVNDDLMEQYSSLHKSKNYGVTGHYFWPHIQACIVDLKPDLLLEYGCGQSSLIDELDYEDAIYHRYDPAILKFSKINVESVDFIINTDVLEHIPEEDLGDVLKHMRSLSPYVFFNIATGTAKHILPNGQNAHCTIWTADKWLAKIQESFPNAVLCFVEEGKNCLIITWNSPVKRLINEIEKYRAIVSIEKVGLLKKIERAVRSIRNMIFGKERVRKIKYSVLGK